jgi:uncharacterized protein YlzI (FlbEa/FlbD family)
MRNSGLGVAIGLAGLGSMLALVQELKISHGYQSAALESSLPMNYIGYKAPEKATREWECKSQVGEIALHDVDNEDRRVARLPHGASHQLLAATIGPEKAQRRAFIATPLKLTRPDKRSTFINPDNVEDIEENPDLRTFTRLTFVSGARIDVIESPNESAALVGNAGVKLIALTRPDKKLRWINPNQVNNVRPSDVTRARFNTNITFGSRMSIYVVEDPLTVASLMMEAGRR